MQMTLKQKFRALKLFPLRRTRLKIFERLNEIGPINERKAYAKFYDINCMLMYESHNLLEDCVAVSMVTVSVVACSIFQSPLYVMTTCLGIGIFVRRPPMGFHFDEHQQDQDKLLSEVQNSDLVKNDVYLRNLFNLHNKYLRWDD